MKKAIFLFIILVLASLGLAACSSGNQTATPPVTTPGTEQVVAEGHIVPLNNLTLFFTPHGRVNELLVEKGQQVSKGQVLARLGDQEAALASLASTKAAQLAAQQAYNDLIRTSDLVHSQSWQVYLQAQQARAAAERAWERLDLKSLDSGIAYAQAQVNARKVDLDNAQKEFDKYKDLDTSNPTRMNAADALTTAQNNYNEALRKLDEANAKKDAPRAALDTARATEAEAKHKFDNTLSGTDVDVLALVNARLEAANANLAVSQSQLDSYELKAPLDGTVADINLKVGQLAGPEAWAFILADVSGWKVETSDLNELDVVKVSPGQAVGITADALPGVVMDGAVEQISLTPKTSAGDVTYTVTILVKNPDPSLRWGMTVEVTFP